MEKKKNISFGIYSIENSLKLFKHLNSLGYTYISFPPDLTRYPGYEILLTENNTIIVLPRSGNTIPLRGVEGFERLTENEVMQLTAEDTNRKRS